MARHRCHNSMGGGGAGGVNIIGGCSQYPTYPQYSQYPIYPMYPRYHQMDPNMYKLYKYMLRQKYVNNSKMFNQVIGDIFASKGPNQTTIKDLFEDVYGMYEKMQYKLPSSLSAFSSPTTSGDSVSSAGIFPLPGTRAHPFDTHASARNLFSGAPSADQTPFVTPQLSPMGPGFLSHPSVNMGGRGNFGRKSIVKSKKRTIKSKNKIVKSRGKRSKSKR